MKLSIVIPVYNERNTLEQLLERVLQAGLPLHEIILVDDGSKDGTRDLLREKIAGRPLCNVVFHEVNQGKGAALRTGFAHATGDVVAVQDADLEYDPKDLLRLLPPLESGQADAVFGSRFRSEGPCRVHAFWHMQINRFLTLASNCFTGLALTDMETCYKVIRRDILQSLPLKENRFGFEPEITARLARCRARVWEVPISYAARTAREGKKIGWKDGVRALWAIFRYNCFS